MNGAELGASGLSLLKPVLLWGLFSIFILEFHARAGFTIRLCIMMRTGHLNQRFVVDIASQNYSHKVIGPLSGPRPPAPLTLGLLGTSRLI
jgi:hypothetical protein